ncbi:MAG: dihydroorotate dehydrogenase electron transfer subunit [Bacillota bacterium]|nr:dihydroorotate dehydrogenase electron transfer subunit [Bacillota bacterium]
MLSKARVLEIRKVSSNCYFLLLEEARIARESLPGQFLHIRIGESLTPFLRRPFSIAGTSPENGTLKILFQVMGEGTRILSMVQKEDRLDCLGPLGSGFSTQKAHNTSVLLAGGIGAAPLMFLSEALLREQKKVIFYYGASSLEQIIPVRSFFPSEAEVYLATEDGSAGYRGFVTEAFQEGLNNGLKPAEIFACGPKPMLQKLAEKNRDWKFPMQISLEERMACGIGACQGCAVTVQEKGETRCGLVCRDGPVFNWDEVVW